MGPRALLALLPLVAAVPAPVRGAEDPGSADIAGRVVDEKGEPVPDFPLRLEPLNDEARRTTPRARPFLARAVSSLDGEFRFPEAPEGRYAIRHALDRRRVGPPVAMDSVDAVVPGTRDLVLVVRLCRPVSGTVRAPGGGPPPGGGRLEARGTRAGSGRAVGRVRLDSGGEFVSDPLDPAFAWEIRARGFAGFVGGGVAVVRPGDDGVEILLDEGGSIEGVVLDQNGDPAPEGLPVRAVASGADRDEDGSARGLTDAAGRFSLGPLGDFEFELHVDGPGPYLLGGRAEGRFRRGAGAVLRVTRWFQAMGILLSAGDARMGTERISVVVPGGTPGQFWTRTRADGTFDFPAPPESDAEFFLGTGRAWVSLGRHRLPSTSLVLRAPPLRPGVGVVAGRVVGPEGSGIGGLVVSFHRLDPATKRPSEEPAATARSGEDGAFASPELPAGRYEVRSAGDGWQPESGSASAPSRGLRLKMRPGGRVTGRLVDPASGEPVPGIEVTLSANGSPALVAGVRTGEDGSFATGFVAPGTYTLHAGTGSLRAPTAVDLPGDYLPRTVEGVATGTADLRVEMTKGLAIGGRVVGADGEALPGEVASRVRVSLHASAGDATGPTALRSAPAAPDGSFRFGSLAPGRWWLQAETAGGGVLPGLLSSVAAPVDAGRLDFALRLALAAPIRGRVLALDGAPAADAAVTLIWLGTDGVQGCASIQAAADGSFSTGPLDGAKTYHLGFSPRGLAPGMALDVRPGASEVVLRPSAGAEIEGVAVDDVGQPVEEGVGVLASAAAGAPGEHYFAHGSALTEPGGRFRIRGLSPGLVYRVSVAAPGTDFLSSGDPLLVRPGVPGLMIRVTRGVALAGVLRDAAGAPVALAALAAEPIREGEPWPPWAARGAFTDSDGRFRIRGLPRGRVRLSVSRGGVVADLGARDAPDERMEVVLPSE